MEDLLFHRAYFNQQYLAQPFFQQQSVFSPIYNQQFIGASQDFNSSKNSDIDVESDDEVPSSKRKKIDLQLKPMLNLSTNSRGKLVFIFMKSRCETSLGFSLIGGCLI